MNCNLDFQILDRQKLINLYFHFSTNISIFNLFIYNKYFSTLLAFQYLNVHVHGMHKRKLIDKSDTCIASISQTFSRSEDVSVNEDPEKRSWRTIVLFKRTRRYNLEKIDGCGNSWIEAIVVINRFDKMQEEYRAVGGLDFIALMRPMPMRCQMLHYRYFVIRLSVLQSALRVLRSSSSGRRWINGCIEIECIDYCNSTDHTVIY